jgi:hypothetical protein
MSEKYQNVIFTIEKIQKIQVNVQLPAQFAEEIADLKKDDRDKKLQAVLQSLWDFESKQPARTNSVQYGVRDINFHPDPKLPSKFLLSRERIEANLSKVIDQPKN